MNDLDNEACTHLALFLIGAVIAFILLGLCGL